MSKKTDIMAALTPYVESITKDLTIGETIIPIKIKPHRHRRDACRARRASRLCGRAGHD